MNKLNGNQIKFAMVVLMTLGSLKSFLPANLAILYTVLATTAVGWFAFAAVEGVSHTSSIIKYNVRLYAGAIILFVGNVVINTGFGMAKAPIGDNGFLTLAFGVTAITAFSKIRMDQMTSEKLLKLSIGVITMALGFVSQYGYIVIPVMIISYFLRKNQTRREYGLIILSMLLLASSIFAGLKSGNIMVEILAKPDFAFIIMVPFLRLYSGQKGSMSKVLQYGFYCYYPVHLWIITIVLNLI
ncbi:MAG: TraX family protein [Anaerovoracaceae bacterium]